MADNGKSKSGKYEQAVARATGATGTANGASHEEEESSAPAIRAPQAMFSKPSQAELDAMMNDPEAEFAPQAKTLEEGEMVCGILEGHGPPAELSRTDPVTKETTITIVPTWIISAPDGGMRVSILSTAQLGKKLIPFINGAVKIVRGKDVKTSGGFRCTDYMVSGPKLPDGKRRSWAQPRVIAIEANPSTTAPQLPAGVVPTAAEGGEDAHA